MNKTIAAQIAEVAVDTTFDKLPAEATIVGSKDKVAAPNAAFANAIQCYGLDFVDDHNESNAHPSPATFPVGMALAESLKKSGKEYIAAVAMGNEVVCRMGTAYLGDMYYQGFHPAMNAIIAARMASKGFNGPSDIFESEDLIYLLDQLGVETGIDFAQLLAAAKYQRERVPGSYSGHHININAPQCVLG